MRRKKGVGVLELLSCLSVVVIGLFIGGVSAWAQDADMIFLYEHTNFTGFNQPFYHDIPDLRQYNWNDKVSSIKVGTHIMIVLYADINYGGASITLYGATVCKNTNGQYSSMPSGWNDRVSSFKIRANDALPGPAPTANQVAVYEHSNYCGAYQIYSRIDVCEDPYIL